MSLYKVSTKMVMNFTYIVSAHSQEDAVEFINHDLAAGNELDQWADAEEVTAVSEITPDQFREECFSAINGHMGERIIQNANVFVGEVLEVMENGDTVVSLPPLLLKRMQLGEGDSVTISEVNGKIVLKKAE